MSYDSMPTSVLVVDADPCLRGVLESWLNECDCILTYAGAGDETWPVEPFELLVVDIAFPRRGGVELLRRLAGAHPGVPIVALSPTFVGPVACAGMVARELGVACVVAKPLTRAALHGAVRRLVPPK